MAAWTIDQESGLCAKCVWRREHERLLEMTWQYPEGSVEYMAVEQALDALERGGVEAIDDGLQARIVRGACQSAAYLEYAKQLQAVAEQLATSDPAVAESLAGFANRHREVA